MVEVHGAPTADETERLSALLRRLLHLDDRHTTPHPGVVPGGLLIVLARNLGYIHLPSTGPAAFRQALERFGTAESSALAAVFWRAGSGRPDAMPRHGRTAAARRGDAIDRRRRGTTASDLRRTLREVERELFELRGRLQVLMAERRSPLDVRRAGIAAVLAVSFTGALAIASLALTGREAVETRASDTVEMLLDGEAAGDSIVPGSTIPIGAIGVQPVTLRAIAPMDDALDAPRAVVDAPPAPRRTASARTRPSRGRRAPAADDATPREEKPAASKRADPLRAQRGGTRGIAF